VPTINTDISSQVFRYFNRSGNITIEFHKAMPSTPWDEEEK